MVGSVHPSHPRSAPVAVKPQFCSVSEFLGDHERCGVIAHTMKFRLVVGTFWWYFFLYFSEAVIGTPNPLEYKPNLAIDFGHLRQ